MKKVLWNDYDRLDRINEEKYPVKLGDIIYVEQDEVNIYYIVGKDGIPLLFSNERYDDIECQLYGHQLLYPIKATRLSRKIYPDAPEKEGMLWLREDE